MKFKQQLKDGLLRQNPVLAQLLGMCSTMAIHDDAVQRHRHGHFRHDHSNLLEYRHFPRCGR